MLLGHYRSFHKVFFYNSVMSKFLPQRMWLTSFHGFRRRILVTRLSSFHKDGNSNGVGNTPKQTNENQSKKTAFKPSSKLIKDLTNPKQSYAHVSSSELMKRCITFTLCRSSLFAKHGLWLFTDGRNVLGRRLFDLVARPLSFSLFVGGEDHKQLEQSFHHCLNNIDFYDNRFKHLQLKPLAIKPSAILSLANLESMTKWLENREVNSELLDTVVSLLCLNKTNDESRRNSDLSSLKQVLSKDFEKECQRFMEICRASRSSSITLFIDAEHSWLQPSVRVLTLALMSHFNIDKTTIANTYQCYLTSSLADITNDFDLSIKKGFNLGCKIVRGAYMHLERDRSNKFEMESPVFDSYQATNENYDQVVKFLLEQKMKHGSRNLVLVATHNSDSVMAAVDKMYELGMECNAYNVHFGQQRAMADPLANALLNNGYTCWKLMPTGSMDELVAFLARRLQENYDALKRISGETRLMRAELVRRTVAAFKK